MGRGHDVWRWDYQQDNYSYDIAGDYFKMLRNIIAPNKGQSSLIIMPEWE